MEMVFICRLLAIYDSIRIIYKYDNCITMWGPKLKVALQASLTELDISTIIAIGAMLTNLAI